MTHQACLRFREASLATQRAHGGIGHVAAARVVERSQGPLAFVDQVVVPPGASVGRHIHGRDEELYVIVLGEAEATVDGKTHVVGPGDVIHNRPGGTHELRNLGADEVRMVVIDVRLTEAD